MNLQEIKKLQKAAGVDDAHSELTSCILRGGSYGCGTEYDEYQVSLERFAKLILNPTKNPESIKIETKIKERFVFTGGN